MPVYIPDPSELIHFGEDIYVNNHAHYVIGNGLHMFDKRPALAPAQAKNRPPFWQMRCTLCRNKGHLFSKCSYKHRGAMCTYCCRVGHIALNCSIRLEMNVQLYTRGYVSEKIDPYDTQALAIDLPEGFEPIPVGQPGHIDYRLFVAMGAINQELPHAIVIHILT